MGENDKATICDALRRTVLGLALFGFSAWLGFVLNINHGPPGAAPAPAGGPRPRSGPRAPKSRLRKPAADDDDLDMTIHEMHHIHVAPNAPETIQWDDWSAGGRFVRDDPKPYDGPSYPPLRNLWEIVRDWNPDNVSMPFPFKEQLQVLNYSDPRERKMAESYRNMEVPFKVFDVPDIEVVRDKWTDGYLVENFDQKHSAQFKVEQSDTNHFMYWRSPSSAGKKAYPDWKSPTKIVSHTFAEWLSLARHADEGELHHSEEHKYLMMGTPPLTSLIRGDEVKRSHFVTSDLKCFTPHDENFFITDISLNKGIQCRFGMRGVIAEAHYDGGRNMVAMLKGAKRYILTPPSSCPKLQLIADRKHPSFRHSTTDWSDPADAKSHFAFPEAEAIDTIVREGEVLYIPSYWIHYIVSLKYSIQCNTRSGSPPNHEGEDHVSKCMGSDTFPKASKSKKRKREKKKAKGSAQKPEHPDKDH